MKDRHGLSRLIVPGDPVTGEDLKDWVSPGDLAREAKVRLFCLPHAGSGTAGFHRWKRLLPEWVAVCPVMLPGREARIDESPLDSINSLVQGLQTSIAPRLGDRPYAIFGHSMGALVGVSWTQAIEDAHLPPPVRLFCSGREAPGNTTEPLSQLRDNALLAGLADRYGLSGGVLLDDPEMLSIFLPTLRADLRAVETYRPQPGSRVSCGVSVYAGMHDRSVSEAGLQAWQSMTEQLIHTARFDGGHFYSFAEGQTQLLTRITEELLY